jgi:hypothetical protein
MIKIQHWKIYAADYNNDSSGKGYGIEENPIGIQTL